MKSITELDKVILVERPGDCLFLRYILDVVGYDYNSKGFLFQICGDKALVFSSYQMYTEIGIQCFAIIDQDSPVSGTIAVRNNCHRLSQQTTDIPDSIEIPKRYLFVTRISDCLNLSSQDFDDIPRLRKKLKRNVTSIEHVPEWTQELIEKLDEL